MGKIIQTISCWKFILILSSLFFCFQTFSYAAAVTLAWDANTEPNLAGYKLYYKTGSCCAPYNGKHPINTALNSPIDVSNVTQYTITGLSDTEIYFFVATAYDNHNNESGYSNEVCYIPSTLMLTGLSLIGNASLIEETIASCYMAFATWFCTQGNSGRLYDTSLHDVTVEPKLYYAWGMGYQQVPNATNWIVFPIPTVGLAKTRLIAINLETVLGGDIVVDRVAVWDGKIKIVPDIVVNWSGEDLGWQVLDLGSDITVASLSISLRTWTGDFGGMVKVYSVCAESK